MKFLPLIFLCGAMPGAFASQRGGGGAGVHAPAHPGVIRTWHNQRSAYGYGYGYGYPLGYLGWGGFDTPYFNPEGYEAPAQSPGNVMVVNAPQPAAAPQPVHSVIREYARPEDYGTPGQRAPEAADAGLDSGPVMYLIAFRDKNIRAAGTYWVQGASLHYLDTDHKERQAPLDSVDRELTAQLNRERRVPFHLP